MKLTLPFFLLMFFVSSWVLGDIAQASYSEKLYCSIATTLGMAYLYDAHGMAFKWIRTALKG